MLHEFIASHEIMSVGIAPPGYFCADMIVDDFNGLINMVVGTDCYISQINWWELAPIATGSVLGMGGPLDPRAPQRRFFSEVVHLGREFDAASTVEDYLSYIEHVKSIYRCAELYPSFDIAEKSAPSSKDYHEKSLLQNTEIDR